MIYTTDNAVHRKDSIKECKSTHFWLTGSNVKWLYCRNNSSRPLNDPISCGTDDKRLFDILRLAYIQAIKNMINYNTKDEICTQCCTQNTKVLSH